MGLEHHRATGGQGRCGVAAGCRERQGKVAGTEHGHRAQADAVLAQVGTRQRLAVRQCVVDTRAVEITSTQHAGEQTHLAAGATPFANDPCGGQRGFAANQRHELITQRIQFNGYRIQKLRAPFSAQATVSRKRRSGGLGSGVDFLRRGLDEIMGQCIAGFGVDAL
ncbi:hypothetical protein D3C87_1466730 [compost metagenome]